MKRVTSTWPMWVPVLAAVVLVVVWGDHHLGGVLVAVVAVVLAVTVLAAVHHAEVVAHRVGEPFGSLVLAVAVLMALALTAIRPRLPFLVALAAVVAVAVGPAVAVKLPHAKQDTYWAQAAAIVQHQRALHPTADEGVVYGSVYKHPTTTGQIIADAYPTAFEGMTDLAAVTNGAEQGVLWDTNGDVATTVPSRLGGIDTVWFVGGTSRNIEPQVTTTLGGSGFHVAGYWKVGTVIISEYRR